LRYLTVIDLVAAPLTDDQMGNTVRR